MRKRIRHKMVMTPDILTLDGVICAGYQAASGKSPDSPYPQGTLKMQAPYFKEGELDFEEVFPDFYWGTINVDISPHKIKMISPDYCFENVRWTDIIEPETFSFNKITFDLEGQKHQGLIYYPHPETKPSLHKHRYDRLEILANKIDGLSYGDKIKIHVNRAAIEVF